MIAEFPRAFSELFKPHRYKVYYGGRGSGKSMSFARALLLLGASRPLTVLCTREIQTSINDSVHRLLREQAEVLGLGGFYTVTKSAIYGRNGTEFTFKGLRFNSREIKSTEGVDLCWVEEGQAVSADSWDVLIPTIRKQGSEIWISFNPLDESDPTYQRFVLSPPEGAYVRKVNYDENPYFPEVLRQEMEWLKKKDYQSYLHIWEGEVRKHSNALVYGGYFKVEEFETPRNARFYHGADWGFAKDPTTLIRSFIDGRTLYIDNEAWGIGVEIDKTPALFDQIETARRWPIKADNARPETISYMRRHGFSITGAKKWAGSIEDGVEFIKTFDIVIHPRCRHTIDEFNHYSYKVDKQTGDILPVIVDANNHCLPPDTLITCIDGNKKIKDVCAGDFVLTRKGYKKVVWAGITKRNAKTSILFAGNYKVIATPDHKIWSVERGWVPLEELQEGESVLCLQKSLKRTALNGIDTQTVKDVQTENIISVGRHGYTDIHGSMSGEKFLRGMLSTIKMVIAKITTSIILSALNLKNIGNVTRLKVNSWKDKLSILKKFDLLPVSGIEAKQAINGIKNTQRNLIGVIMKENQNNASIAVKPSLRKATTTSFAQMLVNQHGEETQALTMLPKNVQFVGSLLQVTNTQKWNVVPVVVQCVKDGETEPAVYDLTVEEQHEFFANGVLVHNCLDALRYSLDGVIKGRGGMRLSKQALRR